MTIFLSDTVNAPSFRNQLAASLPQTLSALVGGVIAFAVSLATNRASNARFREQAALEKDAERTKERRQKGEELFVLLHFWTSHVSGYYLQMNMAIQGKLTLGQVREAFVEQASRFQNKYEAPRIELYITTYFPECAALHIQLLAIMRMLNSIDLEFQHSLDWEEAGRAELLKRYVATQCEFEECHRFLQQRLVETLAAI